MKKLYSFILILNIFCCLLFSCSSSLGDENFIFDNDVTWMSSYSDIKNKYGKPDVEQDYIPNEVYDIDKEFYISAYMNFSYKNCDEFIGGFIFEKETRRLVCIMLLKDYESTFLSAEEYESLVKGLSSDYGNPEKEETEEYFQGALWRNKKEETSIVIINRFNKSISISIEHGDIFGDTSFTTYFDF